MEITHDQINKSKELFIYVNSKTNTTVQLWRKNIEYRLNTIYRYEDSYGKCQAIWSDI